MSQTATVAAPTSASAGPADGQVLLQIKELVKYYPIMGGLLRRHVGDVKAVDGVSLDVRKGEVLGLVGESGCGKTTLGRTVLYLQRPTRGQVIFDGQDMSRLSAGQLRRMRKRMQIIFQDPYGSLNPRMPVLDIIGEGLMAQGVGDSKVRIKKVEDALETVGLRRDYTRRYPHEFSGGQRQRIGIARAMVLRPRFIVADEPVSALDVSVGAQIVNLLKQLQRDFGLTYLFISHSMPIVRYLADRIAVMQRGELVEVAETEQIVTAPQHPYTRTLLAATPELQVTQ